MGPLDVGGGALDARAVGAASLRSGDPPAQRRDRHEVRRHAGVRAVVDVPPAKHGPQGRRAVSRAVRKQRALDLVHERQHRSPGEATLAEHACRMEVDPPALHRERDAVLAERTVIGS